LGLRSAASREYDYFNFHDISFIFKIKSLANCNNTALVLNPFSKTLVRTHNINLRMISAPINHLKL
jgi:hypothetical protein